MAKGNYLEFFKKKQVIKSPVIHSIKYYTFFTIYVLNFLSIVYLKNPFLYHVLFYGVFNAVNFLYEPLSNYDEKSMAILRKQNWIFYFPACLTLVFNEFNFFYSMYLMFSPDYSLFLRLVYLYTAAEKNTLCFNIIHELEHKYGKWKFIGHILSWFSLSKTYFSYFFIDHDYNHHFKYGTPEDSKLPYRGWSFWYYYFIATPKEYITSWKLSFSLSEDPKGFKFLKHNFNGVLNKKIFKIIFNQMIWLHILYVSFFAFYYYWRGAYGVLYSVLVCFHISVYSAVQDYVGHYGLVKKEVSPGVWVEEPGKHYSWNSDVVWDCLILFHGERHLDHHLNYSRPYHLLKFFETNYIPPIKGIDARSIIFRPYEFIEIFERVFKYQEAQEYDFDDELLFPSITFWTIWGELVLSLAVYFGYFLVLLFC